MKRNSGFTLIELIVVIVILGILAVTAAPKFIDLQSDARVAALNGLKASVASAYTLVHGKALTTGQDSAKSGTVKINGNETSICYGYPCAAKTQTSSTPYTGLGSVLDIALPTCAKDLSDDWCEVVDTSTNTVKLYNASYWASNSTTPPKCYVQYAQATYDETTGVISLPKVTIESTGC